MERLMVKADIGSDRTLRKNLARLEGIGLITIKQIGGTQGGNEFTVFLPEEISSATTPTTPTTSTTLHHHDYPGQNVQVVPVVESDSGRGGLNDANTGGSAKSNTLINTNTERDDDEAFADFANAFRQATKEITGRELTATERHKLKELADVLVTELKIAAGRTTVSSVPAFLAEHLRRRLWKKEKRQIEAEAAEQKASAPAGKMDTSKCPDCFGTGMYYPEGFDKGVARCSHSKLIEDKAE